MADIPDDFFIINPKYSKEFHEGTALVFTGFVRTSFEFTDNKVIMKIVKEDLKYVRLVRSNKDEGHKKTE